MLSLNTLPPLSCAWSTLLQCQHKAICKVHEKISTRPYSQKASLQEKRNGTEKGNSKPPSLCFKEIENQLDIIDRLIPAVTALGPDYQLRIDALTPRTFARNLLHSPRLPYQSQIRTFQTKASRTDTGVSDVEHDKQVEEVVQKMTKSLNLSSREAMSFSLGLKEGLRLKPEGKEKKGLSTGRKISLLIFCGAILYLLFNSVRLDVTNRDNMLMNFSKDDYKAEIPDVSFEDVKGMDEVKQELQDVVEFLRDPERFTGLGGKLPKGLLLVGPPGTGKTLLARAVAGEANVPFYFASGSEFDEVFVGVGSARIRKLFSAARENAPCIIFIDEIDACGSKRVSSPLQPHARQTINQLLQEMDGFSAQEGVIVLAATNMGDVLDKALTRPGRFDTDIKIMLPDSKGRKEILELYASRIVHGDDLDLEKIARLTGGMSGAALSNLVNQAALRAGQLRKPYADMSDFEYALDKLHLGPEMKTRKRTEAELEVTAFHEAGHALVAYYTADTMPIYKATIAQRGVALGHVSQIPTQDDETNSTKAKLLAQIDVLMGGRVAEEIMKGQDHVSTGASSDLKNATRIAYSIVCSMGMSDNLGFMQYSYEDASPDTKMRIEAEVNQILKKSYAKAKDLLVKHSHQHKLLAKGLLKYETLSLEEIKVLLASQNIKSVEKLRNQETKKSPEPGVTPSADGIPSII